MIARLFWEQLEQDDITAVGGLTLGADPLVAGVMWWSHGAGRSVEGFSCARSPRTMACGARWRATSPSQARCHPGRNVITSGESGADRGRVGRVVQAEVVRVLAVVDREQGAQQIFQQRGYPSPLFSIGDLFARTRIATNA